MADLQRLTELQLVPVVELRAWAFSDRETPQGPSREHRADWHRYWLDCLEDAGITGLNPIAPGSMHVSTAAFADLATLERVLHKLLDADTLTDPENLTGLSGGVALMSGGAALTEPNCCGDLGDWSEWQSIAEYHESAWTMVWIGHPWLSARSEGDDLILSEPHEGGAPEPRWVLDRALVRPAFEATVRDLEEFADRLTVVLLGDTPENGSRIRSAARRLAGLSSPPESESEEP